MTIKKMKSVPSMDSPSTYRICVQGRIYESWFNRLSGMKVVECCESDGTMQTVLQGKLADQAALAGVLNVLYEMHLPIISAECLGENP